MTKDKPFENAQKIVSDFDLWVKVSKSVAPNHSDFAAELAKFQSDKTKGSPPKTSTRIFIQQTPTKKTATKNPPDLALSGLDRRKQKRFLRGQVDLDARLDLHGENLETAKFKLRQFLTMCYELQHRTVLVITGKGNGGFSRHTLHSRDFYAGSNHTGRLRQALPDWLNEFEFRTIVTGFQPSHPKHGGGGAFYIQLRNKHKKSSQK